MWRRDYRSMVAGAGRSQAIMATVSDCTFCTSHERPRLKFVAGVAWQHQVFLWCGLCSGNFCGVVCVYVCLWVLCLCFFGLGQCVSVMGVVVLVCWLFWAVYSMVVLGLVLQRLP